MELPLVNLITFTNIDNVLQYLCTLTSHTIVWGDININYLLLYVQGKQIDSLLQMYILLGFVDFPTSLPRRSTTAIDFIFLGTSLLKD